MRGQTSSQSPLLPSTFARRPARSRILHNHLRDTLSSQCLAANEALSLDASQSVKNRSQQQENSCSNQAGGIGNQRKPLDDAHGQVDGSAHVIRLEAADEAVKLRRGRADAQEKRDLDEEEDEGADAGGVG